MQITGGFLAESAQIVDQKLNVTGGVMDAIVVPRSGLVDDAGDRLVKTVFLVTLMQAGPDDHLKPYRMVTEAVDPAGTRVVLRDETIEFGAHSGENRFWVNPLGLSVPSSGRLVLIQTIEGGGTVSIPVELIVR